MIELTDEIVDPAAVLAAVQSPQAGAVVLFLGTTRQFTRGRQTMELHYDSYREMANGQLLALEREAHAQWDLVGCQITHRLGRVGVGEISVAVAVSAAHRQPAFEAGQWLIDQLKQRVPIWKQEHWADGTREWIHPAANIDTEKPADA